MFTNRGARLKSWRLKHYLDQHGQPQELVDHDCRTSRCRFRCERRRRRHTASEQRALRRAAASRQRDHASTVDLQFEYRDSGGLAS